jgi:hypothetical protein
LPPDLLDFQRDFAAALDRPAAGAMAVYRNTVLHGAVEALRANYPVVEQIVGADMFKAVAVDFACECPPRHSVLALYGEGFADWIAGQPWSAGLEYLADVARVERMAIESLMAADADPVGRRDIAGNHDDVRLALHPGARFGWLSTPAMTIWLAHQRPFASELQPEWKSEGALFARPSADIVHCPRIGAAAYRILCGIALGETVGGAIAASSSFYPREDCDALFASLLNLSVFVAPTIERN